MTSVAPFNRLVRLAARAFYDDIVYPDDTAAGQEHAQGTAIVVLDALTRRNGQWVREDDLAASLKMEHTPLRRVLRYLEDDKIVATDLRKEPAEPASLAKEGDEKVKVKLHQKSYCCLDYAQACDVIRYRIHIHRMRKKIKDELTADSRATIQHYMCPACGRRYSAFDALGLVADDNECFRCEHCSGELVIENDAKIPGDVGDDGSNARKRRRIEKLQDMQQRMDEQLESLQAQIRRVEGLPAPEFVSLRSWQRANKIGAAAAVTCHREAEVEVGMLLPGADQSGTSNGSGSKVFPPWMLKEGMDFTIQTGGSAPSKGDEKSKAKGDNKIDSKEKEKHILEQAYVKPFYEDVWEDVWKQQQLGTQLKTENGEVEEEVEIDWEDG